MKNNKKFDLNAIKSVHLKLLDSPVDLVLNALMFYKYNLEYVASMFSESEEERIIKLIKSKKHITQAELSKLLSLSENCIYKNLKTLKAKGLI